MNQTEYERRRAEYEQTVLRELRDQLLDPKKQDRRIKEERPRIWVEDVRFDTSDENRSIEILFRDRDRPECLFGYEVEALEHPEALEEEFGDQLHREGRGRDLREHSRGQLGRGNLQYLLWFAGKLLLRRHQLDTIP